MDELEREEAESVGRAEEEEAMNEDSLCENDGGRGREREEDDEKDGRWWLLVER